MFMSVCDIGHSLACEISLLCFVLYFICTVFYFNYKQVIAYKQFETCTYIKIVDLDIC